MSLGNFFSAAGQGLNTYMALASAMEDKKHQRVREGVEDSQWRERMNLDHQRQTAEDRERAYQHTQDNQRSIFDQAKSAGIYGITPDMLNQARDGNQTQTGVGAGQGGQNVLQSALRSLQIASQQPGYDTHKQVDLGNGMFARGPDYQQEPTPHLSPVYGQDNEVGAFDNRTGAVHHTGFIGRTPTGLAADNPRKFQVVETPTGPIVIDKTNPTQGIYVTDPRTGQPVQGKRAEAPNALQQTAVENNAALKAIQQADSAVTATPKAFGIQNVLGDFASQRLDPSGEQARGYVSNLGSLKIKERSGAAVTAKEFPRLSPFVPTSKDTPEAIHAKLKGFAQELQRINDEIAKTFPGDVHVGAAAQQQPADASGTGGPNPEAKAYYQSLRAQGMSADEALQHTDAKYPR
jgi:hypothetical protein